MSEKLIPSTIFNADECQALADLIERVLRLLPDNLMRTTQEELTVLDKLRRGAAFYAPNTFTLRHAGGPSEEDAKG